MYVYCIQLCEWIQWKFQSTFIYAWSKQNTEHSPTSQQHHQHHHHYQQTNKIRATKQNSIFQAKTIFNFRANSISTSNLIIPIGSVGNFIQIILKIKLYTMLFYALMANVNGTRTISIPDNGIWFRIN